MTAKKLCIDCRWVQWSPIDILCAHPDNLSLVDGEPFYRCVYIRAGASNCGPEGIKWEPKFDEDGEVLRYLDSLKVIRKKQEAFGLEKKAWPKKFEQEKARLLKVLHDLWAIVQGKCEVIR